MRQCIKKTSRILPALLFLLALCCLAVPQAEAAAKYKNQWVKSAKGIQYYNEKGKPVKAANGQKYTIVTIKNKKYAFNAKGYQVYGWRRINNKYYYFKFRYRSRGYMLTNAEMHGVKLRKSGSAIVSGSRVKQKLPLLCMYQEWTDQILANTPYGSSLDKLKVCFDYLRRLPYSTVRAFQNFDGRDLWDAEYVFKYRKFDCHRAAAALGYMAMAMGFTDVKVHDLKRAWHSTTQINGRYYDASLARHKLNSYDLFNMDSYYTWSIWLTTDLCK